MKIINEHDYIERGWMKKDIWFETIDGKKKQINLVKRTDALKWSFQPNMYVYDHFESVYFYAKYIGKPKKEDLDFVEKRRNKKRYKPFIPAFDQVMEKYRLRDILEKDEV